MHEHEEKNIAKLLSRMIMGTTTQEEDQVIDDWVAMSDENRAVYENLLSGATVAKRQKINDELNISEELKEVKLRVRRIINRRRKSRWMSGVAAAALVAGILLIGKPRPQQGVELALTPPGTSHAILTVGDAAPVLLDETDDEAAWIKFIAEGTEQEAAAIVKVEVPNGGEYKLRLSDGTLIWLNSESSIEYPAEFTEGERSIRLCGEAYFEVSRDDAAPFTVVTPQMSVTVLGTSFNVSAYEADPSATTTLVSGRVQVCNDSGCIELIPGRQAIVTDGQAEISVKEVDAKLYMAWTTGVFEFENMRLEDICTRLSRWYGVSFRFEGATADERFTGATWKYKPLGELLKGIELVTDVSFTFSDDSVTASYVK